MTTLIITSIAALTFSGFVTRFIVKTILNAR